MQQPLDQAAVPYDRFVPQGIAIPPEPLLRLQGYRDIDRVRDDVRGIAERMAACAEGLLAPEAYYRRVRIEDCTNGALILETGTAFHSMELTKAMTGCREVVVFVLTLGPKIDAKTEAYLKNSDVVEALFLEAAGWIAIERATRELALHLWSLISGLGLRLGRRLGPGYVDWPLEEQRPLFGLLADAPLQVSLLDSCAMSPKKSRSGIYGLHPVGTRA